jgi:hypothetical protein
MSKACGHIHAGSLHTPRLRLVLDFLSDGLPHSTREIVRATGSLAINAVVGELRHHGAEITCVQQAAPTGTGRWFYYTMTKAPKT